MRNGGRMRELMVIPLAGSNLPPFSIVFLKVEALRLKEPSVSVVIFVMSDWLLTSLAAVDM